MESKTNQKLRQEEFMTGSIGLQTTYAPLMTSGSLLGRPTTNTILKSSLTFLVFSCLPDLTSASPLTDCLELCRGRGDYTGLKALWHNVICPTLCYVGPITHTHKF